MTYAAGTSVSVEKSKAALDALLRKHGAGQRVFGDDDVNGKAYVVFALAGRQYATVVGKDDKRRWFPYGMVANEEALQTAAQRLYEGRSRQEFEGSFSCVRMTAPALGQALCAAAYDCKPEGRRLVGLPPPLVRALEAVARAAEEVIRCAESDDDEAGAKAVESLQNALAKLAEVRHA